MRLFRTWEAAKALLAREELAGVTEDGQRALAYRDAADGITAFGTGNVRYRGAWSGGTDYLPNDLVTRGGAGYIAKTANSGVEPGVTTGWADDWDALG